MAGSVNKAILVGNLGRDPEIRFSQAGKKIANFSIATSENWRDRQTGERRERTEWHRIVIFNEALAEIAEKYLKTGSKVYVEAPIRTRKWQGQDGKDNYTTEIVLEPYKGTLTILDRISDGTPNTDQGAGKPDDTAGSTGYPDLDDEIPF
jgi:single-strand DNA-binding protein